jgi:glycosyltransferase involved in cell wall biosynthesis
MRILYLCPDHGIPVFGRKGSSTHVRETCRALVARGHEVILVAGLLTDTPGDEPIDCGFEVVHVPHLKAKWMGADLRLMAYNSRLAKVCRGLMTSFEPELIYERYSLYGSTGGNLAARAMVPYMLEVNTRLVDEQSRRLHFPGIARRIEKSLWKGAPALVAVSTPVGEELIEEGIPRERVRVMPMAVDTHAFRPRADFAVEDLPDGGTTGEGLGIIYMGALTGWHGIETFFHLAERARAESLPLMLTVVGGTKVQVKPLRQRLQEAGLADHLRFMGSVPYGDVPRWLASADVGFLPETSRFSSPTKLFEYMAAGLASVAPRQPAIEEVIRHGENGLLFDPGDLDTLIEALMTLQRDPERRRRLGARARSDAVTKHSWAVNAQTIEEFTAEIMANGWL